MARQTVFLILANLLIPVAILVFATGFFPYKPFLPGLAALGDVQEPAMEQPDAAFDRVVFMVVDALRSDFVYGNNSGVEFTQRYGERPSLGASTDGHALTCTTV